MGFLARGPEPGYSRSISDGDERRPQSYADSPSTRLAHGRPSGQKLEGDRQVAAQGRGLGTFSHLSHTDARPQEVITGVSVYAGVACSVFAGHAEIRGGADEAMDFATRGHFDSHVRLVCRPECSPNQSVCFIVETWHAPDYAGHQGRSDSDSRTRSVLERADCE